MSISLRLFGGIRPKIDAHLLPDHLAQVASGCRLTSGVLSPWRKPVTINTPTKVGTKLSMYRINYASNDYWLHWTTDVNVVKSQIANDAFNRYYYTGDGAPKATTDQLATQGVGTDYPLASFTLGLPAPTTPTIASIIGGAAANQTRSYVYTLVTLWGEEGPPSLPVLNTGKADATWNLTLPQVAQPGGGTYQVVSKNVYRTVTGADGTSTYLFVANVALATLNYADAALDSALIGGTILPSTLWIAPPVGLAGLIPLPNGCMAGFTGNQLCLSEPYQPHAWPLKNRFSVDFNIVGIAANGSTIAVCTTAYPYVFSGASPDAMGAPTKAKVPEPCLSKRSVVDVGWGVLYSSPNGLVNALSDEAENVTASMIHPKDWQSSYFPSTMVGAAYQGYYHGLYARASGVGGGLIVDRSSDFGFKQIPDYVDALWLDPTTGLLYAIMNGDIVKWDADPDNNTTFDWKSRLFVDARPGNYGAIQVDADYSSIGVGVESAAKAAADLTFNAAMLAAATDHGEIGTFSLGDIALGGSLLHGGASLVPRFVTVQILCGGVLRYTKSFTSRIASKLPSGFKDDRYEIRITGNVDLYSIKIAENAKALQRI